jgi:uncharacterized membrane protein
VEAPPKPDMQRRLFYLTLPGCWGALIFSCLSFTPSLLPRTGVTQGLIWGITAAIGYGLGVLVAWIWRAFADRDARRAKRRSWLIFFIVGGVVPAVAFGLGQYWQFLLRKLMGVTEYNIALVVASSFVAAVIFCLILAAGRGVRGICRWLATLLHRWCGGRAANATGSILVAGLTYLLVSGLLLDGFVNIANETFSVRNGITPEGIHQPTSRLRSGGPGSLVAWGSLGREGRKFVATGPSAKGIRSFTHRPAKAPIRAYAGLESAGDTEGRAGLAVDDLEREHGFQRKNVLVFTTTGSGWVDPAWADTFEYLSAGDSAIVAIQYSYLPSWISYLVDQSKAREAGRDLYDAVYDRWSKLPLHHRPNLYVGGESLGSSGAETAFSGRTTCATAPPALCLPGRRTSAPCTGISPITATRAAPECSPSTTMDAPSALRPIPRRIFRRRASRGRAAGFSMPCIRPTRSCGGARTSHSKNRTGSTMLRARMFCGRPYGYRSSASGR